MISRRDMFRFLGVASVATVAPVMASGVALFDPGRRVTRLPGGGTLIEDETFTTGIALTGCTNLVLTGCVISHFDTDIKA